MIKTLLGSVRQYKKPTLLSPLFITLEVVLECIIPLVMAAMIDHMAGETLTPIFKNGAILIVLAMASLYCGRRAAIEAATASAGFSKNLRQDMYFNIQDFSFSDVDRFSTSSLVSLRGKNASSTSVSSTSSQSAPCWASSNSRICICPNSTNR